MARAQLKPILQHIGELSLLAASIVATYAGQSTPAPRNGVRIDRHGDPLPEGAVARLGTLRFRAPDDVTRLAFAPDGKTLAVASHAGLFLYDAGSGRRIRRLPSGNSLSSRLNFLGFSPDGKHLAGMGMAFLDDSEDGPRSVVAIWDLTDTRNPRKYEPGRVVWAGWSPQGEPLAVYLENGALRLQELAAGRSRRFMCKDLPKPEEGGPVSCAHAPAGCVLAVINDERNLIHLWDTGTGRVRCTLRTTAWSVSLSPDGRRLGCRSFDPASGQVKAIQIWDTTTGTLLHTVATDRKALSLIAFAPDGKTLATAGSSGVRFWDIATGRERSRCQGEGSDAAAVAFAPDARTLATAEHYSGTVHTWDVATGKRKPGPSGHTSVPREMAFSADGRRLASAGAMDGTVYVWDLATTESAFRIQRRPEWVTNVAYSRDSRWLYSAWADGRLWISDAATGSREHVITLEDPDRADTYQSAVSMHLSADGKTMVAFSHYEPRKNRGRRYQETLITGWDPLTRKQLFRRRLQGVNNWTTVSADARALATPYPRVDEARAEVLRAPVKWSIRLEDLATGEPLLTVGTSEAQIWPLAFSPDGRLLVSYRFDFRHHKEGTPSHTAERLQVWEVATAAEVLSLPTEENRAAFSPDGLLLAVTTPSREILVWDLAHGRERQRFKGLDARVRSLAFAPEGRRLISGLFDSTLLVWDVSPQAAPRPVKLGAAELRKAWTDLAGSDAARAFRARWALAMSPETALPLLKERLTPAPPPDAQHLGRLLADLDSPRFAVRQKAQQGLEQMEEVAVPALRQALAANPSLEMRRRMEALLARLRGPVTRPDVLLAIRAVAVLEEIATPEARQLLQTLAQGATHARLTQEATAAVKRLHVGR